MVNNLEIVADNELFIVAIKPHGMSFHSEDGAGFVVILSKQQNVPLYPVHRLDKMTSGLVILAKSPSVASEFTQMFTSREIKKTYLAISMRKPRKKQGWIKGDMVKSRRGSYKLLPTSDYPAITHFTSHALRTHERLFVVTPHTGKTHQIRVVLKSIGSPIAGDMRYANSDEAKLEDRGYLHAYRLEFELYGEVYNFVNLPVDGERFRSDEFVKCFANHNRL